jgi:hypothetical protein
MVHKVQVMYLDAIVSRIFQEYSKKLQRHEFMCHHLIYQVCNEFGCCKQLGLQVKENFSKKFMQKLTIKRICNSSHSDISILNVSNNSSYVHKQQTSVYTSPRYKQQLLLVLLFDFNP